MTKLIMSWSKCSIQMGKTGDNDAMATELFDVGVINDKSTNLQAEDGDKLEAKATGGITVAEEESEHKITLTTRVKEPAFDFESKLTGAELNAAKDELKVKTNIVPEDYSVVLTPKNVGATGIKARKTHVAFKPGFSEEEGQFVDLTFTILACGDGELYTKFKKKAPASGS